MSPKNPKHPEDVGQGKVANAGVSISEKLAWNVREVALMTTLSERTIRRLRETGDFPKPRRVGGRVLWIADEVRRWLKRQKTT